jgi:N-methylhydantoinase B
VTLDPGGPNEREILGKGVDLQLRRGDTFALRSSGGGGWGDPRRRTREQVRADLRDGYITEEQARDVYGFVDEDRSRSTEATWRHEE